MIYNVLSKVRELLENDSLIHKVTEGDLSEIDLSKQTIFPLAHFNLGTATQNDYTININIEVIFADIIEEDDSNYIDVWNRTFVSATQFVEQLKRIDTRFIVEDTATHEPFRDRFVNKLGGFATSVIITIPNETAIC